MIRVGMLQEPLDPAKALEGFASPQDGAVLVFMGVVRNQNEGREVRGLEYEAYKEMAEEVLRAIGQEVRERSGSDRILILHRVGRLGIGEVSTLTAIATPHRGEAYEASRYIIEEIKKRLPVWKKEEYVEGGTHWVEGHTPEPEKSV